MMPDMDFNCRSVVAFYGVQLTPARLEMLYAHTIEWFAKVGAPPERLGVTGDGFAGKLRSFHSMDRQLRKSGFANVTQFTMYRLEGEGTVPLWDWSACVEMSPDDSWFIIGASPAFASLPSESLLSISQTVIADLAPIYGTGFRRQMELGPTLYAAGLCQGLQPWGAEEAEVGRISDWSRIGLKHHVYEQGLLREIYPWNFLTEVHLARRIDGIPLKQWIQRDNDRGSLMSAGNGVVLWEVQEQNISNLDATLRRAGLIFDAKAFEAV